MSEGSAVGVFRMADTKSYKYLSYTVDPHSVVSDIWPDLDKDQYEMHDVELTEDGAIRVDIRREKGGNDE